MGYLKFRTIADVSPQGKPKVFLACHPDDFEEYSASIFRDIFSNVDCAVYYMDPTEEYDSEEVLRDISLMQLCVFAVTEKLLSEPNFAMDTLFSYAEKEHIPVLPLLQEEVELDEYSDHFGDLQFLGRFYVTATSISYEDQLQKYLSSVLVDDELAKKVRDAFDAYIFLSYRKKDRKYAQDLMRLIHKNDFCRDVAIWYDEFLVPGENFNEAIRDMMLRSDLFALAVTPNLVNEDNYVMTTEYPHAMEHDKTILPIEMVPTSREELEKKYNGIPPCVDPCIATSLVTALSEALGDISLQKVKNNPDHLYCIGLAYLGGIDVEVDHDKAIDLITAAADEHHSDAQKKLVSMYRNGEGVQRNLKKAIEIQLDYVEHLEACCKENGDNITSSEYPEALFDLSGLYGSCNEYGEQREILEKLIRLCSEGQEEWRFFYRTTAMQSLGKLESRIGNYARAKKYFNESQDFLRAEMDSGKDSASVYYANGCLMLADLCNVYQEKDEAERHVSEAIRTASKYDDCHDFTSTYLFAYMMQGKSATEKGQIDEAERCFNRVEDIYDKLKEAGKDVNYGMAQLTSARNALKSEKKYREDMDKLYRDFNSNMSNDPKINNDNIRQLHEDFKKLKSEKVYNINRDNEIEKLKEVVEKAKVLAESKNIEDERVLAEAYTRLAFAQKAAGQYMESEMSLIPAYTIYEDYLADHPDPEGNHYLIAMMVARVDNAIKIGPDDYAIKQYQEIIRLSEDTVNRRGNARDYEILSSAYSDFAFFLKSINRHDEVENLLNKAIAAAKKMVEIDNGKRQRMILADSYFRLAFSRSSMFTDIDPLLLAYGTYQQIKDDYPNDIAVLGEISSIRGCLMMHRIQLSDIDKMVKGARAREKLSLKKKNKSQETYDKKMKSLIGLVIKKSSNKDSETIDLQIKKNINDIIGMDMVKPEFENRLDENELIKSMDVSAIFGE